MTKEAKREYDRKRYQANKEKRLEQVRQYYQVNKEKVLERQKEYKNTPMGRAINLLNRYNQSDKEYNRGKGDITAEWIVENIFSKPCAHCGKEGWEIIGCNRINNDLPHTKDNVEPCCLNCNCRLPKKMGLTSPS